MTTREQRQRRVLDGLRDCAVAMNGLGHRFALEAGVHPTDLHALELLARCSAADDALTIGELGAQLDMSSGAVTGLVDRLEQAGNVERVADPADRRRVRLRMTDQAHALAQAHFGAYAQRLVRAMAGLPAAQLDLIADFLETARDAADEVGPP